MSVLLDKYEGSKSFIGTNQVNQSFTCKVAQMFPKYKDDSEYEEVEVYSHGVYVHELVHYASETMFTYGYVPVEVMEELVEKHGGIKEN